MNIQILRVKSKTETPLYVVEYILLRRASEGVYLSIQLGYLLLAVSQVGGEFGDGGLQGEGSVLGGAQQGLLLLDLLMEVILGLLVALRLVLQLVCQLCDL